MNNMRPTVDHADPSSAECRNGELADPPGARPREALAALVDYGLSDAEIAPYHDLHPDLVADLLLGWGIAGNP